MSHHTCSTVHYFDGIARSVVTPAVVHVCRGVAYHVEFLLVGYLKVMTGKRKTRRGRKHVELRVVGGVLAENVTLRRICNCRVYSRGRCRRSESVRTRTHSLHPNNRQVALISKPASFHPRIALIPNSQSLDSSINTAQSTTPSTSP
jgi:hypothetical protein